MSAEAPSPAAHDPAPELDGQASARPARWRQKLSPVSMAYFAVLLLAVVGTITALPS